MFKHVYEIDENGYFVRDIVIGEEEATPDNCVETPLESGLFSPKYIDGYWGNGISDEEIDKLMGRDLVTLKAEKDRELNEACKQSILDGFIHAIDGVTYWFSYDYEAQGNFRDAKEMLSDGVIPEITWTVRNGGKDGEYTRIPINLTQIKELGLVIMQHKLDNISKYRDTLLPIVAGAATPEEIAAVTW